LTEKSELCESPKTVRACLAPRRWRKAREALGLPEDLRPKLLAQAFTHTSFAREAQLGPEASNQRLEFLGDAVLDLILVEYLFRTHEAAAEGSLTKMKASAARANTLARVARQMGLGEHLLLGHGEEETGGRKKPSLLEDCLEALVGAMYLSTGLETTREFVLSRFAEVLEDVAARQAAYDHKTALQEFLQQHTKRTPSYETVETLGPAHERTFVVEVSFDGKTIGRGSGSSKQTAQQAAAEEALSTKKAWSEQLGRS